MDLFDGSQEGAVEVGVGVDEEVLQNIGPFRE